MSICWSSDSLLGISIMGTNWPNFVKLGVSSVPLEAPLLYQQGWSCKLVNYVKWVHHIPTILSASGFYAQVSRCWILVLHAGIIEMTVVFFLFLLQTSLSKFVSGCADLLPPLLFVPYMKMLCSLASHPQAARHAFNLLKQNVLGNSVNVSWDHFFQSLNRYPINIYFLVLQVTILRRT